MQIARHDHEPRHHIEPLRRFPQFRQQQHRQQERTRHVGRHRQLVLLGHLKFLGHQPGIRKQHVQSLQPQRARRELRHGFIGREIERPDFDDVVVFFVPAAAAAAGFLDGAFGGEAFVEVADREDEFGGAEAGEVAGGFEAEAGVGTCYDDGLGVEGGVGDRWGDEELGVDLGEDVGERHGEAIVLLLLLLLLFSVFRENGMRIGGYSVTGTCLMKDSSRRTVI